MIVDGCRSLAAIAPLKKYQYVGFGALEFVDFDLVHRALGIAKMTSIEKDDSSLPERYEFNKPFKTVTILFGKASDHLATLDWKGLRIVWLDYEQQLDAEVIRDCETVARVIQPGSLLIVTLNAHAAHGKRLEILKKHVGEERIPDDVTEETLEVWGFAAAQRRILSSVLESVMVSRPDGAHLSQVFNFCYQDGARMQTVGWVFGSPAVDQSIEACRFSDLSFVRTGDKPFVIEVPILTAKEVGHLNAMLPVARGKPSVKWLKDIETKQYADLYRWYPSFLASK
jgi:hypothetical protein